jgi:sugar phosphate isomerase/epimerase
MAIQLYSVRDEMKKDPLSTLKKLAYMGYQHIESANYIERKFYGYYAKDFKLILQDLGLTMPSGHAWFQPKHWNETKKDFTDEWKQTVEDAVEMGQEYLVNFWIDKSIRENEREFMRFIALHNKSGELCRAAGTTFCYHNEHYEFNHKIGDKYMYDVILANTDPSVVAQQLDIGNVINGGAKAIDIINKYPGRFASIHVKDEIRVTGGHNPYQSTVLGTGVIDVEKVLSHAINKGGVKHCVIELENAQQHTPLKGVALCLNQMKQWGY